MEIVTKIAPIALALIMLTLGLGLTIKDFSRVIKQPKDFLVGLICQIILLPIVAFIIIKVFQIRPELALGLMIIAAAPGGVTSNVLTKFANGDVALSISLTAIVSLASIISVPLIIFGSADLLNIGISSTNISMTEIALKMFFVVTLPVIVGMTLRKFFPFFSNEEQLIQRISIFLFIIVFVAIWVEENQNIIYYIKQAGVFTLVLNILMMILGYYVAKIFASGIEQRKCISLECGLQNGTLAVFVATQIFDEIIYIVPTATYALIMFVTSIFFVLFIKNKN